MNILVQERVCIRNDKCYINYWRQSMRLRISFQFRNIVSLPALLMHYLRSHNAQREIIWIYVINHSPQLFFFFKVKSTSTNLISFCKGFKLKGPVHFNNNFGKFLSLINWQQLGISRLFKQLQLSRIAKRSRRLKVTSISIHCVCLKYMIMTFHTN